MSVRKIAIGLIFTAVSLVSNAGVSASITCGQNGSAYDPETSMSQPVYLNVSYPTVTDAGTPGLFWLGVLSPDQTVGAVLTQRGWETYEGGLYPFQSRYDNGFPGTISMSIPFPNNAMQTDGYVGYRVYMGHGAYTNQSRQKIITRREALNRVKPDMVAKGRWNAELDSDDRFIWALIQKDMVDNGKYGAYITVPVLNCVRSRH